MAKIGEPNSLQVTRLASPGVYLDGGEHGEILLPKRYVPQSVAPGDLLEVFVYRDSEDRLVASTEMPKACVGKIASLSVLSVNHRIGAFLDWGLPKDLLLPFREQTGPVQVGQQVLVRIYLDPKTERVVASMKLRGNRVSESPNYRAGQKVEFIVTEKTPLGYKAVVEGLHSGLLYKEGIAQPLAIGQKLTGFVRAVRPDGKLDLRLDPAGYSRVAPLALQIVQALRRNGGRLELDDHSPSERIREAFGASKTAFKQAIGKLYKARRIRLNSAGIELLDNSDWSPGTLPPLRSKTSREG